jgi:hypothetical protein
MWVLQKEWRGDLGQPFAFLFSLWNILSCSFRLPLKWWSWWCVLEWQLDDGRMDYMMKRGSCCSHSLTPMSNEWDY